MNGASCFRQRQKQGSSQTSTLNPGFQFVIQRHNLNETSPLLIGFVGKRLASTLLPLLKKVQEGQATAKFFKMQHALLHLVHGTPIPNCPLWRFKPHFIIFNPPHLHLVCKMCKYFTSIWWPRHRTNLYLGTTQFLSASAAAWNGRNDPSLSVPFKDPLSSYGKTKNGE